MKDPNNNFDDTFQIVARLTIVVPLITIIMALFLKFNANNSQQKGFLEYNYSPTPNKSSESLENLNTNNKSTTSAKINLKGPFNCNFTTDSSTISAQIKDKKIFLKFKEKKETKNYLLTGDCLHIWGEGVYSGEKVCGLSQYLGMADSLLSSNLISPSFIFGSLSNIIPMPTVENSKNTISSLLNSCQKEDIENRRVFEVPTNVLFKKRDLK